MFIYLTEIIEIASDPIAWIAITFLVLLIVVCVRIVIFLLMFARATGQWCFSGSYSSLKQLQSQTILVFTGHCGIVANFQFY
jgi:hypothetical protein